MRYVIFSAYALRLKRNRLVDSISESTGVEL